jgi:hypothetical protein
MECYLNTSVEASYSWNITEGPSPGTVPAQRNDKLVKEALKVFFMEQREDGMWEQGKGFRIVLILLRVYSFLMDYPNKRTTHL